MHPSQLPLDDFLKLCDMQRKRHTGPGGQHRNKVETGVELTHRDTGIAAFAGSCREPERNRRKAVERLRVELAVKHRCVDSSEVQPSELWQLRCRAGKISCNVRHVDFAAMLAEALDAIDAKSYDVRKAAAALGCSSSQLVRFVAKEPEALECVNRARERFGLKRLRP